MPTPIAAPVEVVNAAPVVTFPDVDMDGISSLLLRLVGLCFDVTDHDGRTQTLELVTVDETELTGILFDEASGGYDGPLVSIPLGQVATLAYL